MKPQVDSPMHAPLFPSMKTHLSLAVAGLLLSLDAALGAGATIPQRQPPESYQKMTEDWPFALATPPVAVAEPVKGWASNFYVGGIGKNYENGKEEAFVAIKSKDGQAAFSLYGNQPNGEDISVAGIEWSDNIGKSKVTLKKGSEFATIEFDQVAIQTPAQQAPQQIRPGMPNLPGVRQQPQLRPPTMPGAVVPRPTTIPQPQPQAVPLPGGPSNTNAAPSNSNVTPQNPKQRVRVIKSVP